MLEGSEPGVTFFSVWDLNTERSQRKCCNAKRRQPVSGKIDSFSRFWGFFWFFACERWRYTLGMFGDSSAGCWELGRGSLWDGINFIFGRDTDTKNFIPFSSFRGLFPAFPASISQRVARSGGRSSADNNNSSTHRYSFTSLFC